MAKKERSDADILRDVQTYKYLLQLCGFRWEDIAAATDLEEINREISKMWCHAIIDSKKNGSRKTAIRRIIEHIRNNRESLPELTMGRLIEILNSIDSFYKEKQNKKPENKNQYWYFMAHGLREKDKFYAIRKYCELTKEEKNSLGLPTDFQSYVKENFIDIDDRKLQSNLLQNYEFKIQNKTKNELVIEKIILLYLQSDPSYKDIISKKVKNQIDTIIVQSGLENLHELKSLIPDGKFSDFEKSVENISNIILQEKSIEDLTNNVIDNDKVLSKFPLSIKNIEIDNIGYLNDNLLDDNDLINEYLLKEYKPSDLGEESIEIKESIKRVVNILRRKQTYRVRIYFKLKLESKTINFVEDVRGASSLLSLIRKALNRAIFWDIPCLKEYFPVAQEVYLEDKLFGGDSLAIARSKSRVRLIKSADLNKMLDFEVSFEKRVSKLCEQMTANNISTQQKESLATAISTVLESQISVSLLAENLGKAKDFLVDAIAAKYPKNPDKLDVFLDALAKHMGKSYPLVSQKNLENIDFNSYLEGSDIFQGSFCGFDLIESIAQSSFFARLKLLDEINVDDREYIKSLIKRISEKEHLLTGRKYLRSYPFSLLATECYYKNNILDLRKIGKSSANNKNIFECNNISYQAAFDIIQGYLTEGLYVVARKKIQELEPHLNCFSHFLKAEYYLFNAECIFLSCEEKQDERWLNDCKNNIDLAEKELRLRILKFFRIGEISQGNLSPLFNYWARIFYLRARIGLFFPAFLTRDIGFHQLYEPLILFGRARLNAARDGDTFLSSQMAIYQSWTYLMQAYLENIREGFDKKSCLCWAKNLLDHALIGYKDASNEAYQDYMQKIFSEYDPSKEEDLDLNFENNFTIERPKFMRLIRCDRASDLDNRANLDNEIDSVLIKRQLISKKNGNVQDLFGQHSAWYFYVYAMIKLCDDYSTDNIQDINDRFIEAFDYFFCALSIAQGGARIQGNEKNIRITRNYDRIKFFDRYPPDRFNVSALRGLYFHRFAELVDLSKIFMALTQSLIATSEDDLNLGKSILGNKSDDFLSSVPEDFRFFARSQKNYNVHLRTRFKRLKEYLLEDCLSKLLNLNSQVEILKERDERVTKVFRMLRGD